MSTQEQKKVADGRWGALILFLAPAVMLFGFAYHPWLGNPTDAEFHAELAHAVATDSTRWAISHLGVAIGSGLLLLAFLALRSYLRQASKDRWSALALPFIVMGSVMFAMLPAMEFAPLVAATIGADVEAAQAALDPWFIPTLLISGVLFVVGAIGFAIGIVRSGVLSPGTAWIVAAALFVMAITRIIPLAASLMYIGPVAGIVALWPLAYKMWNRRQAQPESAGAQPAV